MKGKCGSLFNRHKWYYPDATYRECAKYGMHISKEPTGIELLLFWGGPPFISIILSYLWVSFNHLTAQDFLNHVFIFWGIWAIGICILATFQSSGGKD